MNDNVVKKKLSQRDKLDLYRKRKQSTEHHPSLIPTRKKERVLEPKICPSNKSKKRVHTEVSQKPVSDQVKHKLPNSGDKDNKQVENPLRSNCKALDEIVLLPEVAEESNVENESSGFCNPNVLCEDAVHQNEEMEDRKTLQFPQTDSESEKGQRSYFTKPPNKLPADYPHPKTTEVKKPGVFNEVRVKDLVRQFEGSTTKNNIRPKNTKSEGVSVFGSVQGKAAELTRVIQKMSFRDEPSGGILLPVFKLQRSSVTWNQADIQTENVLGKYLVDQDEESIIFCERGEKNVPEASCKNDNDRSSSSESSFTSDVSDENFRVLDEQCFRSLQKNHKVNFSPEKKQLELVPVLKLTETKSPPIVNQNPPLSIHDCEQLVQPFHRVTFSSSHIFSDDSDDEIEFKKSSPLNSISTQLLLKRRGTPRPSKTPKRKDTFLDLSVDFEQTGSFNTSIVRFAKNGDTTVTPVRRSQRLSSTPSVVRKELERFC